MKVQIQFLNVESVNGEKIGKNFPVGIGYDMQEVQALRLNNVARSLPENTWRMSHQGVRPLESVRKSLYNPPW